MTKHLLSWKEWSKKSVEDLLSKSTQLKADSTQSDALKGNTLALLFQKPSARTRVSFEAGMYQLGGQVITLGDREVGLGERETAEDLARVFSRYVNIIALRTFSHSVLERFASAASVPVINALTELYHPCQALADALTIKEHLGEVEGKTVLYLGDGNNVCNSLIALSKLLNFKVTVCCPKGFEPKGEAIDIAEHPKDAIQSADVIYTDVWTSMGQEEERQKRADAFKAYQVNQELINQAPDHCIFMHCLPAHRGEEVTEDVLEGKSSVVFDQAENRLHAQKAILLELLGK